MLFKGKLNYRGCCLWRMCGWCNNYQCQFSFWPGLLHSLHIDGIGKGINPSLPLISIWILNLWEGNQKKLHFLEVMAVHVFYKNQKLYRSIIIYEGTWHWKRYMCNFNEMAPWSLVMCQILELSYRFQIRNWLLKSFNNNCF